MDSYFGEQEPDVVVTMWTDGVFVIKRIQPDLLIDTLSVSERNY